METLTREIVPLFILGPQSPTSTRHFSLRIRHSHIPLVQMSILVLRSPLLIRTSSGQSPTFRTGPQVVTERESVGEILFDRKGVEDDEPVDTKVAEGIGCFQTNRSLVTTTDSVL